jgi:hypothetical protein
MGIENSITNSEDEIMLIPINLCKVEINDHSYPRGVFILKHSHIYPREQIVDQLCHES